MKTFDKCFSNVTASGPYQDITIPVKPQPIGIKKVSVRIAFTVFAFPILLKMALLGYTEPEIWEENIW